MKLEQIELVTIFPSFFESPLKESLLGKAQKKGLVSIRVHNLRDYTSDRHKTVDGKPFGGGPGMVMMPGPIFDCVEELKTKQGWVVLLDPKGERFTQKLARQLTHKRQLIFISGHYEGVDYRVHEHLADQIISVGDFVTMGGEAPALCVIESVVRLLPSVLGNENSLSRESFDEDQLEYPQYTRPQIFRQYKVPKVLVSGNHRQVEKWRIESALSMTAKKRPDLKNKSSE